MEIEYIECKLSKRQTNTTIEVKIRDNIIPQIIRFRYLESITQDDGEIDGDINHRNQVVWMKWRRAITLIYDRNVLLKLKGKFYCITIKLAVLYETER
ncbi:hypothetical protein Lal_00018846 [Lupinus albus]|nr:hypothetical protein Lal_00018846 [Lupinus albus]